MRHPMITCSGLNPLSVLIHESNASSLPPKSPYTKFHLPSVNAIETLNREGLANQLQTSASSSKQICKCQFF